MRTGTSLIFLCAALSSCGDTSTQTDMPPGSPDLSTAMTHPDMTRNMPPPDLTSAAMPDLTSVAMPDLAIVPMPDLAVVPMPDLAIVPMPDLAVVPMPDLAMNQVDMAVAPDMVTPPDMTQPPPDMTPLLTVNNTFAWCTVTVTINGVPTTFGGASMVFPVNSGITVGLSAMPKPNFLPVKWTGVTTMNGPSATYDTTVAPAQMVTACCALGNGGGC
jgi:hypothetical protein